MAKWKTYTTTGGLHFYSSDNTSQYTWSTTTSTGAEIPTYDWYVRAPSYNIYRGSDGLSLVDYLVSYDNPYKFKPKLNSKITIL